MATMIAGSRSNMALRSTQWVRARTICYSHHGLASKIKTSMRRLRSPSSFFQDSLRDLTLLARSPVALCHSKRSWVVPLTLPRMTAAAGVLDLIQPIQCHHFRTCALRICNFEDQQALLYTLTMSDSRLAGGKTDNVLCAVRRPTWSEMMSWFGGFRPMAGP